jgi:RNA 3'-terminal phosphate cyclase (ATP)
VLRTSLALSIVTGEAFVLKNVRAGRPRPGLMRQHLTALEAAATVSDAEVSGAFLGSTEVGFRPKRARAGHYAFSIGTAGSATLVLQTVLPPLLQTDGESNLLLEGGTHNSHSPPFDFLDRVFLPLLQKLGARVEATLERYGFHPAGGGRIRVRILPGKWKAEPWNLRERGPVRSVRGTVLLSALPRTIAEREIRILAERLRSFEPELTTKPIRNAKGPGNVVMVEVESEQVTELFTGFGERGLRAEVVAEGVAAETLEYLESGVPVGRNLADQLLIPLALGAGGSFRTLAPTLHTRTQAEMVRTFLPASIEISELAPNDFWVQVNPNRPT